ncbi:MAG: type I-C CRISPR-associated protein Cas5c [Acidobacteriota bacterium]
MTPTRSPTLSLRARGPLACFTRPELKAERVSYPVPTPSASRGILEAVLWKPGMRWVIETIAVLAPIRYVGLRRNEVNVKAPRPKRTVVDDGGAAPVLYADEHRAQRNTVFLRDVDYVIGAHIRLTDKAGPGDNLTKFVDMFERRVRKGQCFHRPYLGCRELAAEVLPADDTCKPIDDDQDLGLMLWDIDYGAKGNRALFYRATMTRGVINVPAEPDVALEVA